MKSITAKYFERAKRIMISGDHWILTAQAMTKGHLSNVLHKHGFKLRKRWDPIEKGIYLATVARK